MKKLTRILLALLSFVLIVSPLLMLICMATLTPPQYSNTFVGRLDEKCERLASVEGAKIVVVGGSSVAFGLDSAKLEEYTGMPVVNFGLYAALGTKIMLDLSRKDIGEGDVVILSPELDAQTMSMYFSSETTLQAIDDNYKLGWRVRGADNKFSMVGALWKHVANKLEYIRDGAPNPSGVYNSKNFNEYGDLVYEREGNVMDLYYDPNTEIVLDESILEDEFIDYVNEYIKFCERRGATVYFSYCPINELALKPGTDDGVKAAFEKTLKDRIDCEFISDIDDYILGAGYFYDTNFHLNDTGVVYRTQQLAEDINLARNNPYFISATLPEEPKLADNLVFVEGVDANEEYFVYNKLESGNWEICGLTDKGRAADVLVIPRSVQIGETGSGIGVTAIGSGAFSGCSAREIVIPEDTNLRQIMNGAFADAESVKLISIKYASAEDIFPPTDNFSGASRELVIHVPDGSNYSSDYNWSENVKLVDIIPVNFD